MTLEEKAKQAWSNNAKKYGGLDSSYIEGYEHAFEDFKSALRAEIEKSNRETEALLQDAPKGWDTIRKILEESCKKQNDWFLYLLDTVTPKQ